MGITYDLIPLFGDETANEAVARVYTEELINERLEEEGYPIVQAQGAADDEVQRWQQETLTALLRIHPWHQEHIHGTPVLWSDEWTWTIVFAGDSITLRANRPFTRGALDDDEVLDVFRPRPHVLVEPNLGEDGLGWSLLADLPRPIEL